MNSWMKTPLAGTASQGAAGCRAALCGAAWCCAAILVLAGVLLQQANAQGFPPVGSTAPASGSASPFPDPRAPAGGSPFPPPGGASPFPPPGGGASGFGAPPPQGGNPCVAEFTPLRQEAERRAGMVKAASDRRAPPQEACKLIANFANAEAKMVTFMMTKSKTCGIPPEIGAQVKKNHANTLELRKKVCDAANNQQRGPAGPSLSEALGGSALPEASGTRRSGGSTFDTLTGNVLAR